MSVTSVLVGLLLAQGAPEAPSPDPGVITDPGAVKEPAAPADEAKAASEGEPKTEEEAKPEAAAPAVEPEPDGVEEIRAKPVGESTPADIGGPAVTVEAGEKVAKAKKDDRFWSVWGNAEYRTLLVIDEDPSNDMMLIWRAGGDVKVTSNVRAFFRIDLTERFWAEPDESGFLLQDLRVGASYPVEVDVPLDFVGLGTQKATFKTALTLFLPASRASQNQDLYAAPRLSTKARLGIIPGLEAGLDALFHYNFNRYADRAGTQGGMNTQLFTFVGPAVDYGMELPEPLIGNASAGAHIGWTYFRKYNSREAFESEASSQGFWRQDYDWGIYLEYAPYEFVSAALSLEQNALVARDGIVNINPFHRDETELVFSITGTY